MPSNKRLIAVRVTHEQDKAIADGYNAYLAAQVSAGRAPLTFGLWAAEGLTLHAQRTATRIDKRRARAVASG